MISKTELGKRMLKKANLELVETISACSKNKEWIRIAQIISAPKRKRIVANLDKINHESKEGETILVPGKVLSQGELDKKIRVVALLFSQTAKEKIISSKSEAVSIIEEIKKNPGAKGIKIIK